MPLSKLSKYPSPAVKPNVTKSKLPPAPSQKNSLTINTNSGTGSVDPFGLAKAARMFPTAKADETRGELPDGRYITRVENVEFATSRNGHGKMVWKFRIEGPTNEGRVALKNSTFTASEKALTNFLSDLHLCGMTLTVDKLVQLGSRYKELEGLKVQISKKSNEDGSSSIYIERLLDDGKNESSEDEEKKETRRGESDEETSYEDEDE